MMQQNDVLRMAAIKYALNYHGTDSYVREMKQIISRAPYRLSLGQLTTTCRIMKEETGGGHKVEH